MTSDETKLLARIRVWGGMAISPADADTARRLETQGHIVLESTGKTLVALTVERASQNGGVK